MEEWRLQERSPYLNPYNSTTEKDIKNYQPAIEREFKGASYRKIWLDLIQSIFRKINLKIVTSRKWTPLSTLFCLLFPFLSCTQSAVCSAHTCHWHMHFNQQNSNKDGGKFKKFLAHFLSWFLSLTVKTCDFHKNFLIFADISSPISFYSNVNSVRFSCHFAFCCDSGLLNNFVSSVIVIFWGLVG